MQDLYHYLWKRRLKEFKKRLEKRILGSVSTEASGGSWAATRLRRMLLTCRQQPARVAACLVAMVLAMAAIAYARGYFKSHPEVKLADIPSPPVFQWDVATQTLRVVPGRTIQDEQHVLIQIYAKKSVALKQGMTLEEIRKAGGLVILCGAEEEVDGELRFMLWDPEHPESKMEPKSKALEALMARAAGSNGGLALCVPPGE